MINRKWSIILLYFILSLLLTGCKSRLSLSASEFSAKMEENDFKILDISEQYNDDKIIINSFSASKSDYLIYFFVFSDENVAADKFEYNKTYYLKQYTTVLYKVEISGNNYESVKFTAENKIHMFSRTDNTLLFCIADNQYADEIKEYFKVLGY